jgi:nucleotide-binding universal stress UspA family protein
MKTIAVLTDFSERSYHAAAYALHLAQKIKADVLLFNAFLVPSDIPMANAQVAWPVHEYDDLKTDSEKSLKLLRDKLQYSFKEQKLSQDFMPEISYRCEEGPVVNALQSLEKDKNLVLLVAATHGADALSTFVLGNNCAELIDGAKLPILLVPENAVNERLKEVVFATDLNIIDIRYINSVAGLANIFSAHITIVNVVAEIPSNPSHSKAENLFMHEMVQKVAYNRISYRNFINQNVKKGLASILENEKPDMAIMVHRKTNLLDFFFKSSVTKKIAENITIPLLVYPYPVAQVADFCTNI